MAMHLEFVVPGPPISNQQSTTHGKAKLAAWRAKLAGVATKLWSNPILLGELKAIILNFYTGNQPSVDVDNMSKPILDEMQQIVYDDDRQITQAEISHLKIGDAYAIAGVSMSWSRRSRPVCGSYTCVSKILYTHSHFRSDAHGYGTTPEPDR